MATTLKGTYLWVPRKAFVALKRSIDPHEFDPAKFEILRADFDAFWAQVQEADAEMQRHMLGDPR